MILQRRQRRRVQITHDLVETGDLLFQQVVLLLCDLLPLLGYLQSLQQLGVLRVQVFDQHVCFAIFAQLENRAENVEFYFNTFVPKTGCPQGLKKY